MRLLRSRARFTVRRLMVAVAVVAILSETGLTAARLWERSRIYRERVSEFGAIWADSDPHGTFPFGVGAWADTNPNVALPVGVTARDLESYRLRCWRRAAWAEEMALKYDRAARYPWLHVAPDLPEP